MDKSTLKDIFIFDIQENTKLVGAEKHSYYKMKYPDVHERYPFILEKACEPGFDFSKFDWMLDLLEKTEKNAMSTHDASVAVGERLVDEHVKPKLNLNQSI